MWYGLVLRAAQCDSMAMLWDVKKRDRAMFIHTTPFCRLSQYNSTQNLMSQLLNNEQVDVDIMCLSDVMEWIKDGVSLIKVYLLNSTSPSLSTRDWLLVKKSSWRRCSSSEND